MLSSSSFFFFLSLLKDGKLFYILLIFLINDSFSRLKVSRPSSTDYLLLFPVYLCQSFYLSVVLTLIPFIYPSRKFMQGYYVFSSFVFFIYMSECVCVCVSVCVCVCVRERERERESVCRIIFPGV